MKKIIIIITIILLLSNSFIVKASKDSAEEKIIIVDPGHGGLDAGAVIKNKQEKDLNLKISLILKEGLNKRGIKVIMTRDGDYDLSKPNALYRKKSDFDNRIRLINNSKAYMYISIHQNMFNNSKYYGPQVFYNDKTNLKIANKIQKNLNKISKSNRQIKTIPNTYMYSKLNIPGVLIECGFMSNPEELSKLQNEYYQEKIVNSIIEAILP